MTRLLPLLAVLACASRVATPKVSPEESAAAEAAAREEALGRAASGLECPQEQLTVKGPITHLEIAGCGGVRHYSLTCDGTLHEWGPPPASEPPLESDEPPRSVCNTQRLPHAPPVAPGARGTADVRCIVTAEGYVEHCVYENAVPGAEEAILAQLYGMRLQAPTVGGRAAGISVVFHIKLVGTAQNPSPVPSAPY